MSAQLKEQHYVPELQPGTRVRVIRGIGSGPVLTATIICALVNPSQRAENQWYDVQFDEGNKRGRFHVSFLKPMPKA